jgi:hypothetical protein
MNEFEKRIDFYIQNFDTEKLLYKKGHLWAKKGWLSKNEFLAICLWKSRRPKNLYKKNSNSAIKSITKKAFIQKDEAKKMKLLTKLSGVEVPTASAILSVTNPKSYPVIDIRCVESLRELNLISWKNISVTSWVKYLDVIRNISKAKKKTAREVEKGLFAFNRLKLDKELINLYGLREK